MRLIILKLMNRKVKSAKRVALIKAMDFCRTQIWWRLEKNLQWANTILWQRAILLGLVVPKRTLINSVWLSPFSKQRRWFVTCLLIAMVRIIINHFRLCLTQKSLLSKWLNSLTPPCSFLSHSWPLIWSSRTGRLRPRLSTRAKLRSTRAENSSK